MKSSEMLKEKADYYNLVFYLLYISLFVNIIFLFRAITSINVALILIWGLVTSIKNPGKVFNPAIKNIFFLGCVAFYILQFIPLFENDDSAVLWRDIGLKSGLVIIPLAVLSSSTFLNKTTARHLLFFFTLVLLAACLFCLCVSCINYAKGGMVDVFFYHALVNPLLQHAIQFSIFVLIALIYLLEEIRQRSFFANGKILHLLLIVFFTGFLVLLSSKLIIALYVFYIIYYALRSSNTIFARPAGIAFFFILLISIFSITLATQNPVSKRFREIIAGDISLIKQKTFTQADYFNGVQFRLLQWRFVYEILSERKSWLTGLGTGARQALDEKYIETNMYQGNQESGDPGFLGYNTHNQLLQSTLEFGMTGAAIFVFIIYTLVKMAIARKDRYLSFTVLILLCYSMTESVFETQYGLLIFTFFPLFFYLGSFPQASQASVKSDAERKRFD